MVFGYHDKPKQTPGNIIICNGNTMKYYWFYVLYYCNIIAKVSGLMWIHHINIMIGVYHYLRHDMHIQLMIMRYHDTIRIFFIERYKKY